MFTYTIGHDPAVTTFRARPSRTYDLVTCLDVIDIVEPKYLDAVPLDVATFTAGLAVFDCLTRPRPDSPLRPYAQFYWTHRIQQHMDVVKTQVEFPGMEGFERAVIVAARAGSRSVPSLPNANVVCRNQSGTETTRRA